MYQEHMLLDVPTPGEKLENAGAEYKLRSACDPRERETGKLSWHKYGGHQGSQRRSSGRECVVELIRRR